MNIELTKEQVQYIDRRLENDGVIYWDVRIELLDHVVSDIEKKLTLKNSENEFEEFVQESFVAIGWKENFNGSSFEKILKETLKNLVKKYRKQHRETVLSCFRNTRFMIKALLLTLLYFTLSSFTSSKQFLLLSLILFWSPILLVLYESIKLNGKKTGKSFNKEQALSFVTVSFMAFHVFLYLMLDRSVEFSIPIEYHKSILFMIIPVHLFFFYGAYKTYKKTIVDVEIVRKQLFDS
jgi:hypothetical protein